MSYLASSIRYPVSSFSYSPPCFLSFSFTINDLRLTVFSRLFRLSGLFSLYLVCLVVSSLTSHHYEHICQFFPHSPIRSSTHSLILLPTALGCLLNHSAVFLSPSLKDVFGFQPKIFAAFAGFRETLSISPGLFSILSGTIFV